MKSINKTTIINLAIKKRERISKTGVATANTGVRKRLAGTHLTDARVRYNRIAGIHTGANGMVNALASSSSMKNLTDDVHYCAVWAEVNYTPVNDQNGKSIGILTRSAVHACINTATAALVSSGLKLRSLWTIEDLLAIDNFQRIAENNDVDFETLHILIAIARYWVKVSPEALVQLNKAVCFKILF